MPADGQVLADDGNARAVDVSLRPVTASALSQPTAQSFLSRSPAAARSLAFWQGPWDYPKQLILYATNDTVRTLSGVSGVNSLALPARGHRARPANATVARSAVLARPNVGTGALTDPPVTRATGDWPGRGFADQMTTFVYVLAGFALITAVFLIANTMNTLMAEQTAEIGVMKAIGGRRRQIAGVFLRAALYLAAFGVVIGVPLGALLAT